MFGGVAKTTTNESGVEIIRLRFFHAPNMRGARIFMRRTVEMLRAAPGLKFREVRTLDQIAHLATPRTGRPAPRTANVVGRRAGNRRKSSHRSVPRAYSAERVVRGLVGKRSDAHSRPPVVRIPST
ncbi:MAG: hypothetical protein C0483_14505 [Pirellula sp.]|nr:hypothetical protein [Pirellula sp.]